MNVIRKYNTLPCHQEFSDLNTSCLEGHLETIGRGFAMMGPDHAESANQKGLYRQCLEVGK